MSKYAQFNLQAGIFCPAVSGNETGCVTDAAFMYSALHQDVFWGYYLNWGDAALGGAVARALATTARQMYVQIPTRSAGAIDVGGGWNSELVCTFAGAALQACSGRSNGEPTYSTEHPLHLSTMLAGDWLAPVAGACADAAAALGPAMDDPGFRTYFAGDGWWKGAAQSARTLIHGIAVAERCAPD